jgi:hypothetical protein
MALTAEQRQRQAAQRRLREELRTGTFRPSPLGKKARQAAAIGSSSREDIRADLEERTLRHAVAIYGDDFKFNPDAVETRIKGGVIITREVNNHKVSEYIPMAKLEKGSVVHPDGHKTSPGKGKAIQIGGMSNEQLRNAIGMNREEWDKLARRKLGRGRVNRWMYH